ncbi:MAG: hypothetical protein OHK0039_13250 [Bacteroidia bacterium]
MKLLTLLGYLPLQGDILVRHDKIYAVLGVLLVIFGGVLAYLVQAGRKARALEARIKDLEEKA